VVDDNLTNLDVAKGLMKPYGMQIECVSSGQASIDAIRDEKVRYNAIFMDQMMPGMDGIEAVRHIREIGTDYAKNIPIIALTANAIAGSDKMFLSKGFQDYLSKPIDLSRLDEAIHRWVRDKAKETPANGETAENETAASSGRMIGTHIAGLDIEKGLERFSGDEETYLDVLRSYVVNTIPLLDLLENVKEDNLTEYATTVHGIKGSSRGIFAEQLGDLAEKLEKASKAGDFAFVSQNTPVLIETVENLIADIEDMLTKIDAGSKKPKKDKPDSEMLLKLRVACETYSMDEAQAIMSEIDQYHYDNDDGLVDWLRENVKLTRFKQINEKLAEL
jgi:CheY-like chemotaxis protein